MKITSFKIILLFALCNINTWLFSQNKNTVYYIFPAEVNTILKEIINDYDTTCYFVLRKTKGYFSLKISNGIESISKYIHHNGRFVIVNDKRIPLYFSFEVSPIKLMKLTNGEKYIGKISIINEGLVEGIIFDLQNVIDLSYLGNRCRKKESRRIKKIKQSIAHKNSDIDFGKHYVNSFHDLEYITFDNGKEVLHLSPEAEAKIANKFGPISKDSYFYITLDFNNIVCCRSFASKDDFFIRNSNIYLMIKDTLYPIIIESDILFFDR